MRERNIDRDRGKESRTGRNCERGRARLACMDKYRRMCAKERCGNSIESNICMPGTDSTGSCCLWFRGTAACVQPEHVLLACSSHDRVKRGAECDVSCEA
eukprot:3348956-Rhodomonas_salina.2